MRLTVRPDVPLTHDFDPEARLSAMLPDRFVKGMFFTRFVAALGPAWAEVKPRLVGLPRFGSYLPFADYPQVDFMRVVWEVARRQHPDVAPSEAARRTAREDFATFGRSRLGTFVLQLTKDVRGGFEHLPGAWNACVTHARMAGEPTRDGWRLRIDDFQGWADSYVAGQLEGVAAHFGARVEIDLDWSDSLVPRYELRFL